MEAHLSAAQTRLQRLGLYLAASLLTSAEVAEREANEARDASDRTSRDRAAEVAALKLKIAAFQDK